MATNLALDDELLEQAVTLGGLKTKKATVTLALKEFIQRREAEKLIDTFGTVDFDANYNRNGSRKCYVICSHSSSARFDRKFSLASPMMRNL